MGKQLISLGGRTFADRMREAKAEAADLLSQISEVLEDADAPLSDAQRAVLSNLFNDGAEAQVIDSAIGDDDNDGETTDAPGDILSSIDSTDDDDVTESSRPRVIKL